MYAQRQICQINGDGIGQEVVPAALNVLNRMHPGLSITQREAGWNTFQAVGDSAPASTLDAIQRCGAAIFGAVSSPSRKVANYQSAILKIRQGLGLHANIRPIDSRFGTNNSRLGKRSDSKFRFVIVRENSEGLYARIEESDGESVFAKKVVTRAASEKIARTALEIARRYDVQRITVVHKANILPESDGLFLNAVRSTIENNISNEESLVVDQLLVDTCALKIVESPEAFGVIVTTNLYGDILSDVAAYWCGGLQLAPSINMSDHVAVCEPVHGSAPDIAGQGVADPRAAILSLALLCRLHWNDPSAAEALESAVIESLKCDRLRTTEEIQNFVEQSIGSVQYGT